MNKRKVILTSVIGVCLSMSLNNTFAIHEPTVGNPDTVISEVVQTPQEILNDYKLKTIDNLNYYLYSKMKKISLEQKKEIYPKLYQIIIEADKEFDKQIINKYFALQEAGYKSIDVKPWCQNFENIYKEKIDQGFNKLVDSSNITIIKQKVQEQFNKYKPQLDILLEKKIKEKYDKLTPEETLKQYDQLLTKISNAEQKFKIFLNQTIDNKVKEKYMLVNKILDYIKEKIQNYKESTEQVLNILTTK